MKLLYKLERRFGKYAIQNLMKYIVVLYAVGLILGTMNAPYFSNLLSLNFNMIFKGQVWRLVTFLIPITTIRSILYVFIEIYLYYMIGNALERAWGAFRFNMYFFMGILFNVIASAIVFAFTGFSISPGLKYINRSMFFAFAAMYPNMQFLIYFFIPVKVKYLAYIYGALMAYDLFSYLFSGSIATALLGISIVVSMANFLIFFFATRNYKKISYGEFQRKARFKQQMRQGMNTGGTTSRGKSVITRHKCAICGRTELDDDELEFRFCSKCDGNYEYCMEHLFTHEHVKK
ncbi:MAG: hypothetical protein GX288_02210 [Clostridiales bacterium]|nr:hypothetical protein [Clostridiales bacterium]